MNYIKKLFFLSIVTISIINLLPVKAYAEKKIGFLIFNEEVRYFESQKGITDELEANGFGKLVAKHIIRNAKGSKAKAAELAREFAATKMDLIIAIGTEATVPLAKTTKNIPIVFSTVYDPVEAKIAKSWKSSGNNTTGSSTKIPMSDIVKILKEFAPVKKLAVLYTPGEKNTEAQLIELQKIQSDLQIKIVPIILTKKEEVAINLSEVVKTVDAIYLTGSSIIGITVPTIVNIANKEKIITLSHLDDLVNKGALLGICPNSYLVGRLAGKKAVKVLKGAKPLSIPIEVEKKVDIILNKKTAKAGQFQIPSVFLKNVTKTIE